MFIGLWIGLTVVAGILTFFVFYWVAGGFEPARATPPVALNSPTAAPPTPAAVAPTIPAAATPATSACNYPAAPASGFGYGIQSHAFGGGDNFFGQITSLGFQWIKVQVRWQDLEKTAGSIEWGALDNIMRKACESNLRVMLSVVTSPEWTRANPMPAENGEAPSDNYQLYADFVGKIIDHYPGQVGALEVWNEENLEREWNTPAGISAAEYVKLLQTAYTVIKSKDPNVVVISGALSPTGVNCNGTWPDCQGGRPVVVDDVTYLKQFVQAGGPAYADCIGVHSNGSNLPPEADGANPPPHTDEKFTGPWDNPHYSWALRSQVEAYVAILNNPAKLQCMTEFGYASAFNGQYAPNFDFAADITEQEQGEYLVRAFTWMRESGKVKMAFMFNLDYGVLGGDAATDDNVIFSLMVKNPTDGSTIWRPAFDMLKAMEKK